jgi:hypothetical protein
MNPEHEIPGNHWGDFDNDGDPDVPADHFYRVIEKTDLEVIN